MQSNPSSQIDITVVVPVFRSASTLEHLYQSVCRVLDGMSANWELIMVDDASPDDSFEIMQNLRAADRRVRIVQLSRNHGQQHATLCGMNYSRGDFTITLDDDLQFMPEDIPKFVALLREGMHVVIGRICEGGKRHAWWRNMGSRMNQYFAGQILGKPANLYLSSYRGFSRYAVDKVRAYRGAHPHITALFLKSVPPRYVTNVDVAHRSRIDGTYSTYSVAKLIKVASYLLINHSYLPLRYMIGGGLVLSISSLVFALWVTVGVLFFGSKVVGWASLAVLISFLSGSILLCLGIVGEYMARLVEEASSVEQCTVFREDI